MALFPAYGVHPPTGISPATASLPGGCIGQLPMETPATLLPASDLVEEWRSDLGVTIATGVSQWTGTIAGTNAVQATAGAQPLSDTSPQFQNHPAFTFDGSNDELTIALARPAPSVTQSCYWVVFSQVQWVSNTPVFSGAGGTSHAFYANPGAPRLTAFNGSNANTNSNAPVGTTRLGVIAMTNSTSDFTQIGSVTVSGANAGNASAASLVLASFGGSGFGKVTLCHFLITPGPLTQAKRDTLTRGFYRRLYGVGPLS